MSMQLSNVIAIVTHRENYELFKNLMRSIGYGYKTYPIVVVVNDAINTGESFIEKRYKSLEKYGVKIILNKKDGFELGALKRVLEETDYENILLLQDSCEILKEILFYKIFYAYGDYSVAISERFLSYLGKYKRSILEKMDIPEVTTKRDSIFQEGKFNDAYIKACGEKIIFLCKRFGYSKYKGNSHEEKFGRKNLVSSHKWIKKYKMVYNLELLAEYEKTHNN